MTSHYDVFFSASCRRRFQQFCRDLHSAVPTTCLWAAAVECPVSSLPGFVRREASLTTCLRSPPSVQRQVQASDMIDGNEVPLYSSTTWPAPTDGPAVHWLHHHGQPGHAGDSPEDCQQCGHDIGRHLHHLGVGGTSRCHMMSLKTISLVPQTAIRMPRSYSPLRKGTLLRLLSGH